MSLQEIVRNLGSLPVFRDLEPEALRLIAFSAETRILRAGDVLFRKGDRSDGGYMILSGALAFDDGTSASLVLEPPSLIGETALVTTTTHSATVLARAPSSVLRISRELYRRVLAEYPQSASKIRSAAATRALALSGELQRFRQRYS